MGYKFIFSKNKGKTSLMVRFCDTQGLWNLLIPKCDGLVAKPLKACPAKSRIIPNHCDKSKKAKGKRGYYG
jgi:hypothetical protein